MIKPPQTPNAPPTAGTANTAAPQADTGTAPLKRGQSAQVQRDLRSKAALKANMARRKAQMRAKHTEVADQSGPEPE